MSNSTQAAPWLDQALAFAAMGWAVVPVHNPSGNPDCPCSCRHSDCPSPAKHPRTPHGEKDASADPEQIRAWAREFPFANLAVALAPSGLVAVSPDSPAAAAQFLALGLPDGPRYQTGGGEGHWHQLLGRPAGCAVHRICRSGEYDLLSNGCVVAPPSLHVSGRRYHWLVPPEEHPLADAPAWVVARLSEAASQDEAHRQARNEQARRRGHTPRWEVDPVDYAGLDYWSGRKAKLKPDGGIDRSATLMAIACSLAGIGVDEADIAVELADRDIVLGFDKFSARKDDGAQYREMARKAVDRVGADVRPLRAGTYPSKNGNSRRPDEAPRLPGDPDAPPRRGEEFQFHYQSDCRETSDNGTGTAAPFRLLSLEEVCALPPPEWQVEGLFQEESLLLVYGLSTHCKSLLTLDLALSIAQGCESWFGRRILKPGPVVWVNADGGRGITPRVNAWRARNPGPFRYPFYTLMGSVHLNRPEEMSPLREQLAALPVRPVFSVFDTLSRCIPGVKENDAQEMTRVTELCHKLKLALPATVTLIHHTDKAGKWDRGSGVVGNESDTKIRVVYDEATKTGSVRCEKERDGAVFQPFGFKVVRQDASVVIVQHDEPGENLSEEKRLRMALLLEVLTEYEGASADFLASQAEIPLPTVHRLLRELQTEQPPVVFKGPVVNYGEETWKKQKPAGYFLVRTAEQD